MRLLLIAIMIAASLSPVRARIGESREQCLARYQKLLKKTDAMIPGSDPEAELYDKDGVTITVHYKAGRAWHITYAHPSMAEPERRIYLLANAGDDSWIRPDGERIMERTYWVSKQRKIVAVFSGSSANTMLEIMTPECVRGLGAERDTRLRQAQRDAVGLKKSEPLSTTKPEPKPDPTKPDPAKPAQPGKPEVDPLKGF